MKSFDQFILRNRGGNCIATPTLSLHMFTTAPLVDIGVRAAATIEAYVAEIAGSRLVTKFKQSGVPGALSEAGFAADMKHLRSAEKLNRYRVVYDEEPSGWVGTMGVYFDGASDAALAEEPGSTNMLRLDFPPEFGTAENAGSTYVLILRLVSLFAPDFGYCGYTIKRSEGTLRASRAGVLAAVRRFQGFDPCHLPMRFSMAGRTFGAHWIDVLGSGLVNRLQPETLLRQLEGLQTSTAGETIVLRNSFAPPFADKNRLPEDQGLLPSVSRFLAPARSALTGFGTPDFDVQEWLARFDGLDDGIWDNRDFVPRDDA